MHGTLRRTRHVFPLFACLVLFASSPAGSSAQTIGNPAQPRNLIVNGGFENGTTGWTRVESPIRTTARHCCGSASINFGWLGNGFIYQELSIPETAPRADVGYWLRREKTGSGYVSVDVYPLLSAGPNAAPLANVAVHDASNTTIDTWTWYGANLAQFKGQTIRLQFTLGGFNSATPIYFFLDDVELWTNFVFRLPGPC
jgi:hypothetical protein